MTVLSINKNDGGYFIDTPILADINALRYHGTFGTTPIFPRYDFSADRASHRIKFYTMLPIRRALKTFLVEVNFSCNINPLEENSLPQVIVNFNEFCRSKIETIDVDFILKIIRNKK